MTERLVQRSTEKRIPIKKMKKEKTTKKKWEKKMKEKETYDKEEGNRHGRVRDECNRQAQISTTAGKG